MKQEPTWLSPHTQPALEFERATGLTGIAGRYVFPEGLSAEAFEKRYAWRYGAEASRPEIMRGSPLSVPSGMASALAQLQKVMVETGFSGSKFAKKLWSDAVGAEFQHVMKTPEHPYRVMQRALWDELVSLNPALEKVTFDRMEGQQIHDAMMGVSSGFNVDDINYFLRRPPGYTPQSVENIQQTAITEKTSVRPGWRLSPETRAHIMQQLGISPAAPMASSAIPPLSPRSPRGPS